MNTDLSKLRKKELKSGFDLLFTDQIKERFPNYEFSKELEIREVEVRIDPQDEYVLVD